MLHITQHNSELLHGMLNGIAIERSGLSNANRISAFAWMAVGVRLRSEVDDPRSPLAQHPPTPRQYSLPGHFLRRKVSFLMPVMGGCQCRRYPYRINKAPIVEREPANDR